MKIMENDFDCRKCNGKMVHERFYDYLDETGKFRFNGWRCLVCGNIVDPVILENRNMASHGKPKVNRKRRFELV